MVKLLVDIVLGWNRGGGGAIFGTMEVCIDSRKYSSHENDLDL